MFPTSRLSIVAPLLALTLGACTTKQLDRPLSEDSSLSRLTDCGQLRTYVGDVMLEQLLQSQYPNARWYFDAPMAEDASADDGGGGDDGPSDYTTTNTQEEGVDEIDIVKTDGKHIFTVQDRALHIVSSWPVEDAELVATLELDGWARGMFLKGDKLEVTTSAKTEVWSIHSDADSLELQILIARVNGALNDAPTNTNSATSAEGSTSSRQRSGGFEPHPDTDWYRPGVMEVADKERHVAVTASSPVQAQHIVSEVCSQVRAAVAAPDAKGLPVVMTINPATLPESDATRELLEAASDEASALTHYRPAKPFTVTCTWSVG